MRHTARAMWVLALVVLATSATAQAHSRVVSKAFDGSVVNDCGATLVEGHNLTEVCFDINGGDNTLYLAINDDSDLPVAALVYFEDDHNKLIESRGTKEHLLCNRGESRGLLTYDPFFLVPPLATKVLVYLGQDSRDWDTYPLGQCLISGRPAVWGTTGTIEAIFDGGS